MSRRNQGWTVLGLIAACFVLWLAWSWTATDPERLLRMARVELAKRNLERAESLARQVATTKSATAPWGAIVAAEAALKQGQHARALVYYQQVPVSAEEASLSAQFGAAEMLAHSGQLSASERALRRLLNYAPDHVLAHYRLAFLLNITGRRWEAGRHLLFLVKSDAAELEHLLLLGNTERTIEDQALLAESRQQAPEDPLPLLGLARLESTLSRPTEARRLMRQVQTRSLSDPEVDVRWGQLILDAGSRDEFLRWNAQLPGPSEAHPDIWLLRGVFWLKSDQPAWAIRCFWEALRREPELRQANYQLGQALSRLKDPRAGRFLERADQLLQLALVLDDLFHTRTHLESMQRAAELTEQLGRLWEARGWALMALRAAPQSTWAQRLVRRLEPRLAGSVPQTIPERQLALAIDLSDFPLPTWPSPGESVELVEAAGSRSSVRFRDDSARLGAPFLYFQSPDPSTPGARLFETTGGGVAALDYDNDLWPDLYFTQGCDFPADRAETGGGPAAPAAPHRDQLRRNIAGVRFDEITRSARLGDPDFSQGVTAGDFDNDGFQDLYVANIGRNRLYWNQGDGTFVDVTDSAGLNGDWWTTSCLIADLNGDALPDLYDVNYVAGDAFTTLLCEKRGLVRSCSPRAFPAAPDQVWLNQGDGRFLEAPRDCGIDLPQGYGLGIVAANFADNGRLSLFVANDEVPNYFFVNRTVSPQDPEASPESSGPRAAGRLLFEEFGYPSGLAVDAEGASQACMGVAAGDADGDGRLDLFVTNFFNESDTLYRQTGLLQFTDDTRRARLRDPTFAMLGFGAQFLDADLDGALDLILTNGHIDDMTSLGEPYEMPPQFFLNTGRGVFQEGAPAALGPMFERKYLGRGLARLDWNRDGRDDFCVSHIGGPALLATNETRATGKFLAIRLVGTNDTRDAIGARLEIQVEDRTLVRELTAGDGYQASNSRTLNLGLGDVDTINTVSIQWLNGRRQTWSSVPVDQSVLIIEGVDRLWPVP